MNLLIFNHAHNLPTRANPSTTASLCRAQSCSSPARRCSSPSWLCGTPWWERAGRWPSQAPARAGARADRQLIAHNAHATHTHTTRTQYSHAGFVDVDAILPTQPAKRPSRKLRASRGFTEKVLRATHARTRLIMCKPTPTTYAHTRTHNRMHAGSARVHVRDHRPPEGERLVLKFQILESARLTVKKPWPSSALANVTALRCFLRRVVSQPS